MRRIGWRWLAKGRSIEAHWRQSIKAKSEVVVEVAIMQVRRDKLRTLGISPPTSATVSLQSNVNSTTTPTTGTTTGSTSTTIAQRRGALT